jgi:hypothetical protein
MVMAMTPEPGGVSGVARSVVDAMRTSPLLLAMIVFNLIFVIIIYLAIKNNRESIYGIQRDILKQMAEQDQRSNALLVSCIQTLQKTEGDGARQPISLDPSRP